MTEMGNQDSLTVDDGPTGAIIVHGDIDVAGGPILEAAILKREGSDPLVIDLGDVFFIDSSGLRILLGLHTDLSAGPGSLTLQAPSDPVMRLLSITGLVEHFQLT